MQMKFTVESDVYAVMVVETNHIEDTSEINMLNKGLIDKVKITGME